MGSDLKVGDVMKKQVITVKEEENVIEVSKLMKKYDIGSIVVIKDKKAEGIITERDIIRKIVAKGENLQDTTAKMVMTEPIMVIRAEASLEEAAKAMKMHHIKRLPVIDEDKELIGIISQGDITDVFPAIIDLLEEKTRL